MYATKTVSSQTTSEWIPMDDNQAAFNASVAVTVSGTLTYSVEFTLDNVQDPTITPTAFLTTLTGATTSQSLAVHYPVKAFRLNVTAFTSGSAIITVLQGSSWDGAATVGNSLLGELAAIYRPAPIPGFAPRLLASLVDSSTAACTSGVVTVTAAAHLIHATNFNGYSFYYPGSASLAAGWYSNFLYTSVNTITFSAPLSANFTSESVNAGSAFTSEVTFESVVIPANTFVPGDRVVLATFRASNTTAGSKITKLKINETAISTVTNTSTTAIIGASDFSFTLISNTLAVSQVSVNGTLGNSQGKMTVDLATDLTISISNSLSAAGMFIAFTASKLRIE